MAGYAAVVSLKKTIEHILESSRISLVPQSPEILQLAYRELEPLRQILQRLDSRSISKSRKKVNAVDGRIKDAVWRFEDLLESHLSHQILSQFERERDHVLMLFSIDLQGLRRDVCFFIETLKDMQKDYIYELNNMPRVEVDESGWTSGIDDFWGMKVDMVGLWRDFKHTRNRLALEYGGNFFLAITGMAGIGKTTLAKKFFEDSVISSFFEHRVWLRVGRKSQFNEVARGILAEVDLNINKIEEGDEKIGEKLKERLEGKRCFIVLDDVWDTQLLDYLGTSLPDQNKGKIRILLTTRQLHVARHISGIHEKSVQVHRMQRLNDEESKDLLREKVFGKDDFPRQLEKAAEKIAENCEGLPLMIVTVADSLSKAKNNDPQYWNEVANKRSSVFVDAYNQISKVLFPSYDCLPQHIKMFLLYVGAFPQDYEIPVSKINNLLTVERFSEVQNFNEIPSKDDFLNDILISRKWTTITWVIKTCQVYSWWRHLLNREASKDKFLAVLDRGDDGLEQEGIKGQRRLCLHTNFLFSFKKVYNSVKCDCASTARSLLCFGPYHQYSMPLDVGFKLLRVLDALKVRFYTFPIEILKLVLLQYLALTYNGKLPTSISKLFNLQFLIIHPYMSIKSCRAPSYVPVQIWDMQELKHIEILGSSLPNPICATTLQKLSTLLGVSASSCTREVLKKIPNIKKLGIQIELTPHEDDSNTLSCFDRISKLENLETLKYSMVNPEVKYGLIAPLTPPAPPPPPPMFSSTLQKLHLSGLGYPWKYMKVIGSLPNLVVLKLRCYAFHGPKWGAKRKSFLGLQFLLIEDTNLVQWKPGHGSFPQLRTLRLKHCYKLQELHWPSDHPVGRIELVDCNPLAVSCANELKPKNKYRRLDVTARSSLDGDPTDD